MRCWVLVSLKYIIFSYFFCSKNFSIPPHQSSKRFREEGNIHAVFWGGLNADDNSKVVGGTQTDTFNLLGPLFASQSCVGELGKRDRKAAGVFFLFSFLISILA